MRKLLLAWFAALVAGIDPVKANTQHFVLVTDCNSTVMDGGFLEMSYNALMKGISDGRDMKLSVPSCVTKLELATMAAIEPLHVVLVGFSISLEFSPLANLYTSSKFTVIDSVPDNLEGSSNLQAIIFAEDYGAFSAGALAGLATRNKVVGGIFGVPITVLKRFRNGYLNGVYHVCPECTVVSQYIHHFGAYDAGYEIAEYQIEEAEADVIFAAAGGTGVGSLIAATERKTKAIGVDTDQFHTVFNSNSSDPNAKFLISSVMKRVDSAVSKVIEDHFKNEFGAGKTFTLDYSLEGLGLAPCNAACDKITPKIMSDAVAVETQLKNDLLKTHVESSSGRMIYSGYWNPVLPPNSWTPLHTFGFTPPKFHSAGSTVATGPLGFENLFYIFGGRTVEEPGGSNLLSSFDLESLSFTRHTPKNLLRGFGYNNTSGERGEFPVGRTETSLVALLDDLDGRLVLFGGQRDATRLNDLWVFLPAVPFQFPYERWLKLTDNTEFNAGPTSRAGHACAAVPGGMIYCHGGIDYEGGLLKDLWSVKIGQSNGDSPPAFEWGLLCITCTPVARKKHSMIYYEDSLYLHGGVDVFQRHLTDFWRYDLRTHQWERLSDSIYPRANFHVSIANVKISGEGLETVFVFSGGDSDIEQSSSEKNVLHTYIPKKARWTIIPSYTPDSACFAQGTDEDEINYGLPTKMRHRSGHVTFVLPSSHGNDKLVSLGGLEGSDLLLNVEIFHFREDAVEEDRQLLSDGVKTLCRAMAAVNWISASLCMLWMFVFQDTPIVRLAQRNFLSLVCFGCIMSSSSIWLFTIDDSMGAAFAQENGGNSEADLACALQVWTFGIGFVTTMAPLFSKLYVVMRLFGISYFSKREKRVFSPGGREKPRVGQRTSHEFLYGQIGTIVAVEGIILLTWTVVDPLYYSRETVVSDEYGTVLQSRGLCKGENDYTFVILMGVFHLFVLFWLNYICYLTLDVHTTMSEAKYIRYSTMSSLQVTMLCIPVMFVSADNPTSIAILRAGYVFMCDFSVLAFVFVPKIYASIYGVDESEGGAIGGSVVQKLMPSMVDKTASIEIGGKTKIVPVDDGRASRPLESSAVTSFS